MSDVIRTPKILVGTKYVTVNDPLWLSTLFANHLYEPVIVPLKVERGGVVMYHLMVRDLNTGKTLDVNFSCPERLTPTVKLATSSEEDGVLVAEWETNDLDSKTFKDDVNKCLEFWLKQIQTANSFGQVPTVRLLQQSTKLKWPWKTGSNEDYFRKFRPEQHTHQFKLGVGYYNQEYNECGVSLQLSSYPGKTVSVLTEQRSQRRGKRSRTEAAIDASEKVLEEDGQLESVE